MLRVASAQGGARRCRCSARLLVLLAAGCSSQVPPTRDAGPPDARAQEASAQDAGPEHVAVHGPLESLTVDGASGSLPLVPTFDPVLHDYYVRCPAAVNAVTVTFRAGHGYEGQLSAPIKTPLAQSRTIAFNLDANAAVVATATNGQASVDYWVRCLPPDFPQLSMTLHPDVGSVTPGYYLVGSSNVPAGGTGYAMVLDTQGVPVWYSRQPQGVYDVDNVVPGAISFLPEYVGQPFEIDHLASGVVATIPVYDGHELRVLPDGHYITIESPVTTADLTGLVNPLPDGGTQAFGPGSTIWTCNLYELDASGNVVWSWFGLDHLDPVKDMTYLQWPEISNGKQVIEPFHCNSADVDAMGNILVSGRDMDSVFYVQRPSGQVLWKMGGSRYTKDGAKYVPVDHPFHRQHDARFQASWKPTCRGGSGQISVYDDESGTPGPARAALYDVVVDLDVAADAGCAGGTGGTTGATLAWHYDASGITPGLGSFRILPDGSRTIGWGLGLPLAFSEVTEKGGDLLDFSFPDGTSTYRAVKVPLSAFALDLLRRTAGK